MAGRGNRNLHDSRSSKQDEFYTQLSTIEEELRHYKEHFKDKIVFCNCDDPFESNFFKYFALNFNHLGLKKLICTSYSTSPIFRKQMSLFGEDYEPLTAASDNKTPYKIEITEIPEEDGHYDMSDVEFLLKSDKNTLVPLKGNGDFRSSECKKLLEECDIVCTNPPYSLMQTFLPMLIESGKKFIILGNTNHITLQEIKPHILKDNLWFGYTHGHFWFMVPDYYEPKKTDYKEDENGQKWRRMGNSCWFTNIDIERKHTPLDLYETYTPEKYPKYDEIDAIECGITAKIPEDYFGMIGVPVSYMPYHCGEQFHVLDIITPKINGKSKYKRVLIQRVEEESNENRAETN